MFFLSFFGCNSLLTPDSQIELLLALSMQTFTYRFLGEELTLLPSKAIWWQKKHALIIADWHIGKVGHFRKEGFAIPNKIHGAELKKLERLTSEFNIGKLLILGDLFHSLPNKETQDFNRWIEKQPFTVELILGNHDSYSVKEISEKISCNTESREFPFQFTHEPLEEQQIAPNFYGLSGHIHPMVQLVGKGKQSLRLPCFYFGKRKGLLPAFGTFTGGHVIKCKKDTIVFPITQNRVFPPIKNG